MVTDHQIVRLGGCDGRGDPEPGVPSLHPEGGQGQPGQHQSKVIPNMVMLNMTNSKAK